VGDTRIEQPSQPGSWGCALFFFLLFKCGTPPAARYFFREPYDAGPMLGRLLDELLEHMLQDFVRPEDLLILAQVSHRFRKLVGSGQLWRHVLSAAGFSGLVDLLSDPEPKNWRNVYVAALCLPSLVSAERMAAELALCEDGCTVISPARNGSTWHTDRALDRAFQANRPWHCLEEFCSVYFEVCKTIAPSSERASENKGIPRAASYRSRLGAPRAGVALRILVTRADTTLAGEHRAAPCRAAHRRLRWLHRRWACTAVVQALKSAGLEAGVVRIPRYVYARHCHICSGTWLSPATSASGLALCYHICTGDWAHRCHICTASRSETATCNMQ
jgi:hypothetical protein